MQYENVKDQFVVVPKRDLLRKEGFLPPLQDFDDISQLEEHKEQLEPGGDDNGGDIELQKQENANSIEEAIERVKHLQ